MDRHIISLDPEGKKVQAQKGERLLTALVSAGVQIRADCGGKGICGRCRVRFLKQAPVPTEADRCLISLPELHAGWRLACQHTVEGDVTLWVPSLREASYQKVAEPLHEVPHDPKASFAYLEVSSQKKRSDLERLRAALGEEVELPLPLLQGLPRVLREGAGKLVLIRVGKKAVAVRPGYESTRLLGLAVDIGTSTLAAYLIDLAKGSELGAKAMANPQLPFGADVLSRITYVREHGKESLKTLSEGVVKGVNRLAEELTCEAGGTPDEIVHLTLVGNPTMLHLFLGVDPSLIGEAPFLPVWKEALSLRAGELGLKAHPQAVVEVLPFIAGYVGADTVAGILACRLHKEEAPCLLLDLGTNGEIVLGWRERILACSAAAGPAFEGGRISCGMPALEGAISHVRFEDGKLSFEVIGGKEPLGICGSGLVDLLAVLLEEGLVDAKGRLAPHPDHPLSPRVLSFGREARFLVTEGIYLTQGDLRELQLAKAAIRAGIEILVEKAGIALQEIRRVYLAGAFGSQMHSQSLAKMGLIPKELFPKVWFVGNTAGAGAIMALLDRDAMKEATRIAKMADYIELSYEKKFAEEFVEHINFEMQ